MANPLQNSALRRLLIQPILFAIPFAFFFSFLQGDGIRTVGAYYVATLIFAFCVVFAIEANRRWVVPRIAPPEPRASGLPRPIQIASYATAAMLGSVLAGLILHFTIAPDTFGSGRDIVLLLMFSALFTALFLGLIYARRMKRLYDRRLRNEVETETREAHELKVAAAIQQALLPPRLHSGKTYAAAAASIPCRTIGGDFFEYLALPGERVGFALGDVAGKGPPAAILASLVQGIFSTHVGEDDGPARTMTRLNQALLRRGIEARFATMAYVVLGADGELTSCSAGHNPAFLIGANGAIRRLEKGGLVVGAFENAAYEEETMKLEPGDTLVLFSDGVSDAENPGGEQFGEDRLRAILTDDAARLTPEGILDRVLRATREFAGDQPPADDITVLVVRYFGRDARLATS
ncbi:MAG: PP2C family protein-serine/threonine phosphatase [Candidatus Eiseniibacteriota bacterium]